MFKEVESFIKENGLLDGVGHVIVALSGGADSVCLLELMKRLSEETQKREGEKKDRRDSRKKEREDGREIRGFEISAVHINHGIREESDEEEKFVKALCDRLVIPCKIIRLDVPAYADTNGLGIEEAARLLRYKALENEAKRIIGDRTEEDDSANGPAAGDKTEETKESVGQVRIALAHHRDDQAETVIFNLFRGSELKGLSGMRPKNGIYIRPLLFAGKEDILSYVKERGLSFVTDESNYDVTYSRNRIRHNILPEADKVHGKSAEKIAETADRLAAASDYIENETAKAFEAVVRDENGSLSAYKKEIAKLHPFMQQSVLYEMICKAGGHKKDITHKHAEDLLKLMNNRNGGQISLPYGLTGYCDQSCISVKKEEPAGRSAACNIRFSIFLRKDLDSVPDSRYTKWLDYDKIGRQPEVRTRRPGDYIFFEDDKGNLHKKSIKDYFINEKISRSERDKILLVADGDHILWIVGHRISAAVKISDETKEVLVVSAEETDK